MGYNPRNYRDSGKQFQKITVKMPTTAAATEDVDGVKIDNWFSLEPASEKTQILNGAEQCKKKFAGRYCVFDRETDDTIMPAVYAHKDVPYGGPVFYGNM